MTAVEVFKFKPGKNTGIVKFQERKFKTPLFRQQIKKNIFSKKL